MIYLDSAATTSVAPEVFEAMKPWLTEKFGNPSSHYELGYEARKAVETAREQIANYLHCSPCDIYFTGGGSESNNTVINNENISKRATFITDAIEHHSVLNAALDLHCKLKIIPVHSNGMINMGKLEETLKRAREPFVSVMMVNNEIGTIEPLYSVSALAKKYHATLHTDAVQAFGKMRIDLRDLNVDFLSASAHKIHGPKGVGLLYANQKFKPLIKGGQQEYGRRAGTENVAGIVGFAKAVELCKSRSALAWTAKRYFLDSLRRSGLRYMINGNVNQSSSNIVNICFFGIRAEQLLVVLSEHDIYCSSGSACNSNSNEPSHVLRAIGLSEGFANSSIRFSFDNSTTMEDIDQLMKVLVNTVPMMIGG